MEIKALKGLVLNRCVLRFPHSKVLPGHTNVTLTDVVIGGRSFRLVHDLIDLISRAWSCELTIPYEVTWTSRFDLHFPSAW